MKLTLMRIPNVKIVFKFKNLKLEKNIMEVLTPHSTKCNIKISWSLFYFIYVFISVKILNFILNPKFVMYISIYNFRKSLFKNKLLLYS